MYLVAIGWIYVVLMMAAAEALSPQGTVFGALCTFVLYGVIPLSIVLYLMGTPQRRKARKQAEAAAAAQQLASPEAAMTSVPLPTAGSESTEATESASSDQPNDSGHAATGASVHPFVAERKES